MTEVMDFTAPSVEAPEPIDFTNTRPPVLFKLDGDTFYGVRDLPAVKALEFSGYAGKIGDTDAPIAERVAIFTEVINLLLEPRSANHFIARLHSVDNPIGLTTLTNVIKWLFEQYAGRPTSPGSDSSPGSDNPESGTSSTASTSAEE